MKGECAMKYARVTENMMPALNKASDSIYNYRKEELMYREVIYSRSGKRYNLYPMGKGTDVTIIFDWDTNDDRLTNIVWYFFGDLERDYLLKVLEQYETLDAAEFKSKYGM